MFKNREYLRPLLLDVIVILSILFFGLMINNNTLKNEPVHNNDPVSAFISVSDKSAVSNACARFQVYQKTWILNKDNYNILAFNRNPFSMNLKTEMNINSFLILRQSLDKIPQFIRRYHLYPEETDAFPLLG